VTSCDVSALPPPFSGPLSGRVGSGGKGVRYAPGIEDYTNKYKGEQVEVALFGGEYQEGVLTAYCYVEDVAHIELNGHILVPLQNIASLHCSSRCDAPEDDWPPRGLEQEDGN
jgi:hypothetical protein